LVPGHRTLSDAGTAELAMNVVSRERRMVAADVVPARGTHTAPIA
jgi:hypothetical protein